MITHHIWWLSKTCFIPARHAADFLNPPFSTTKLATRSTPSLFFKFVLDAHSQRIRFHHLKVRSYQRSQIYLVDDEKIGARNTRAALARYLFAFCDIDDVDGKVGQLGAEGCLDLVAARRK